MSKPGKNLSLLHDMYHVIDCITITEKWDICKRIEVFQRNKSYSDFLACWIPKWIPMADSSMTSNVHRVTYGKISNVSTFSPSSSRTPANILPWELKTSNALSKMRKWNAGVSNFLRNFHFLWVEIKSPVPSQGWKKKNHNGNVWNQ